MTTSNINRKNKIQTFLPFASYAAAKLPRAGLGNMMLVWAQALVFSELNSIRLIPTFWHPVRIGPWLRKEKDKRYYGSLFLGGNHLERLELYFDEKLNPEKVHYNVPVQKVDLADYLEKKTDKTVFVFNEMPDWQDYFGSIKSYHKLVKKSFLRLVRPKILDEISSKKEPVVGIHIRLGDYKEAIAKTDYSIHRNIRTPLSWYISVLEAIREEIGYPIQATVFSDGYESELQPILSLSNVTLSKSNCALIDMLSMSKSRILISSSHSTFSGWASFLGQIPTVKYPKRAHLYKTILCNESRRKKFEGPYDPQNNFMPALLRKNLFDCF